MLLPRAQCPSKINKFLPLTHRRCALNLKWISSKPFRIRWNWPQPGGRAEFRNTPAYSPRSSPAFRATATDLDGRYRLASVNQIINSSDLNVCIMCCSRFKWWMCRYVYRVGNVRRISDNGRSWSEARNDVLISVGVYGNACYKLRSVVAHLWLSFSLATLAIRRF